MCAILVSFYEDMRVMIRKGTDHAKILQETYQIYEPKPCPDTFMRQIRTTNLRDEASKK